MHAKFLLEKLNTRSYLGNTGLEEFCLLRYIAMQSVENQPTFLRNMSLHKLPELRFLLASWWFLSEDGGEMSSEMAVDSQRTMRRYISEDWNLRKKRCKNLKYHSTDLDGIKVDLRQKDCENIGWIKLDRDRIQWQDYVNMLIKCWVPQRWEVSSVTEWLSLFE